MSADNNSGSHNNSSDNLSNPGSSEGAGSKKPRNLHIAHRRSPSELTTLMVEQYNLQRQLEQVQLQQKQIMQAQQMTQQYSYPSKNSGGNNSGGSNTNTNASELMPPPSNYRSHSRSSSINSNSGASGQGHRRT